MSLFLQNNIVGAEKPKQPVCLKHTDEDIVSFLLPYAWCFVNNQKFGDAEKTEANYRTLAVIDPNIQSRGMTVFGDLWKSAVEKVRIVSDQDELKKLHIEAEIRNKHDKVRDEAFSDIMLQFLLPYVKAGCKNYGKAGEADKRDGIYKCLWKMHGNIKDNVSPYDEEVFECFWRNFSQLFPELNGDGQGFRFTYVKFREKILEMKIWERAQKEIATLGLAPVSYSNSSFQTIILEQVGLIRANQEKINAKLSLNKDNEIKDGFCCSSVCERYYNSKKVNVTTINFTQSYQVARTVTVSRFKHGKEITEIEVQPFQKRWACPWLLYPIVRMWYDSKEVVLSRSKLGLGLLRKIYERCWSGSVPEIKNSWIDNCNVTQDADGRASREELEQNWYAFYKDRLKLPLARLDDSFSHTILNQVASDKALRDVLHEFVLALDQCDKTYKRYPEYVSKSSSSSNGRDEINFNCGKDESNSEYWVLKALSEAQKDLMTATKNFNEKWKTVNESKRYIW